MAEPVILDEIAQQAAPHLNPAKMFEPRHNTTAYLLHVPDKRDNRVFFPVVDFFLRSRVSHALTAHVENIYEHHMTDFWSSAVFRRDDGIQRIEAIIDGKPIVLTEGMIRQTLQFEDDLNANNDIPGHIVDACLGEMGSIRLPNEKEIKKYHVCPHWKFFETIIIGCLSPRKGGLDGLNYSLAGLMVALIQNRPYNFSRFILSNLISNLDDPFFMYPRFLQLIFNAHIPNLPLNGRILKYSPIPKRVFSDCHKYRGKPIPPVQPLFGHVIDENFIPLIIDIDMDSEDEEDEEIEEEEQEHVGVAQEVDENVTPGKLGA